jgi:hypothetical protein
MQEAAAPLAAWETFYVITGAAAAALTGLMFVAITLIAGSEREHRSSDALGAFATPTIVHFACALLIAITLGAPWPALAYVGVLIGLLGLGGVIYTIIVILRTRRQADYEPVLEDWLWHTIFPLIAYAALVIAALLLLINPGLGLSLFLIGGVSALLLSIGIHNAWDDVIYLATEYPKKPENKK